MTWIAIGIVVVILVAALLAAAIARNGKEDATGGVGLPYEPIPDLFTAAERSFLGVLDQAMGAEYRVFGKVRLADLARVRRGLGRAASQGALNRIAAKHVDFVVCRADSLTVLCAVELNDRSHATARARARDDLVAGVCSIIGLPLVTFQAKAAYSVEEVREQIHGALRQHSPASDPTSPPALP